MSYYRNKSVSKILMQWTIIQTQNLHISAHCVPPVLLKWKDVQVIIVTAVQNGGF